MPRRCNRVDARSHAHDCASASMEMISRTDSWEMRRSRTPVGAYWEPKSAELPAVSSGSLAAVFASAAAWRARLVLVGFHGVVVLQGGNAHVSQIVRCVNDVGPPDVAAEGEDLATEVAEHQVSRLVGRGRVDLASSGVELWQFFRSTTASEPSVRTGSPL